MAQIYRNFKYLKRHKVRYRFDHKKMNQKNFNIFKNKKLDYEKIFGNRGFNWTFIVQ